MSDQFVQVLLENMELFADSSVTNEIDFRRLLLDWMEVIMNKNIEIQQSLNQRYNSWEQSYNEEKEIKEIY